jgi:Predicted membrane protein (DUF2207)
MQVHDWGGMAGTLVAATLTAWILLLLASVFVRGPRPTPGPATPTPDPETLTPRPEPPAIIDLLVHSWERTRAVPVDRLAAIRDHIDLLAQGWRPTGVAAVATLLDLASRGHVLLIAGPDSTLMAEVPDQRPAEVLAPFEQQLQKQIDSRLSGGPAPAAALLPDPEDEDGQRWYATFESAVIDEARRLDLVRDRYSTTVRWGLRAAVVLPAAALSWWLVSIDWQSVGSLLSSLAAWGLLSLATAVLGWTVWKGLSLPGLIGTVSGGRRATAAGRVAASHWLGVRAAMLAAPQPYQLPEAWVSLDDRKLGWAVALDAAPDVLRTLSTESGRTWSSAGDRWRQVRVPSKCSNLYVRGSARWSAWWNPEAVSRRRTFTGRVIRRWKRTDSPDTIYRYCHLAVDDGHSDWALPLWVRRGQYRRFALDSSVRVTVDHKDRLIEIRKAVETRPADALTRFDEYVAWYSWAASNFACDPIVCHAAAAAATQALAAGRDRYAAVAAAYGAARAAGRRRVDTQESSIHGYPTRD